MDLLGFIKLMDEAVTLENINVKKRILKVCLGQCGKSLRTQKAEGRVRVSHSEGTTGCLNLKMRRLGTGYVCALLTL